VLRENIAEWLSQPPLASRVLAFCTAPREQGGAGAVVVLLAQPRRNKKA
jgi:DNA-nicking Smr family endonuclease